MGGLGFRVRVKVSLVFLRFGQTKTKATGQAHL
jgi:hypothetical protein